MPIENSVVDRIRRLTPAEPASESSGKLRRVIRVEFVDRKNAFVLLDAGGAHGGPWRRVLESAHERHEPVFVQYEPATRFMVKLRCVVRSRVGAITTVEGIVHIELIDSAVHYFLSEKQLDYGHLIGVLTQAQQSGRSVIVADDPRTHQIVDARIDPFFVPISFAVPPPTGFGHTVLLHAVVAEGSAGGAPPGPPPSPPSTPPSVTLTEAEDLFALVDGTTCDATLPTPPCIPFLYPDNFCWARAHEMCRLLIKEGAEPRKLWVYSPTGSYLVVSTPNNPSCEVRWRWHVAPVLDVDDSGTRVRYVFDPALFPTPTLQSDWFDALGCPTATTAPTEAAVYRRRSDGTLVYEDPMYPYAMTRQDLAAARDCLTTLSEEYGPPPYAQCLRAPGTGGSTSPAARE